MSSIRVLLSIAANHDWNLHLFYVKNVFLHGNLEEEVYMELPVGFEKINGSRKVCKLKKKSSYGLKQPPRAWFVRFTKSLNFMGFVKIKETICCFTNNPH